MISPFLLNQLQEVILNIRGTFYETIKRNTWMTNDTKKVALAKVKSIIFVPIGLILNEFLGAINE